MKQFLYRTMLMMAMVVVMFAGFATPVSADAPAPDNQTADYEIKFMEDMIDHHMMAVMMAEMCTMKAVHPELVAMCGEIMTTQMHEIEMMQMWLQDWYGITYEPDMTMSGMEGHMIMDPTSFEVWFMKRMISHHAGALKEGQDCLDNAYHSELLSMCQNIIVTQAQEIETMQSWLCEWYGYCNYRKNL